MEDDSSPVLEKIRKLLALSASSNPNEAALAAAKAQALLIQHNLSYVSLEHAPEEDASYLREWVDTGTRVWCRSLLNILALNNFCTVVYDLEKKRSALIGRKTNQEAVLVLYHSLFTQLRTMATIAYKESQSHMHPVKWKEDFYSGAIVSIQKRLQAQKQAMVAESHACRALIVVNDEALKKTVNRLYPAMRKGNKVARASDGYYAGHAAGDRVVLNAVLP